VPSISVSSLCPPLSFGSRPARFGAREPLLALLRRTSGRPLDATASRPCAAAFRLQATRTARSKIDGPIVYPFACVTGPPWTSGLSPPPVHEIVSSRASRPIRDGRRRSSPVASQKGVAYRSTQARAGFFAKRPLCFAE
jgi:hypothetical protein